jgi:hypothetical protein
MKGKRKWLLCPLIVVALLLCAIPAYADMPTLPHAFYGTLTITGSPAPVGTVVTAKVNDVECGSITTTVAGQYGGSGAFDDKLTVTGEIETGATIKFYVGVAYTGEAYNYAFSPGAVTEHNLVVGVDDDPPEVDLTPLSPDPTNDNTPTFTGTAVDALSNIASVEYQVGTGSWRAWVAATAVDGAFDEPSEDYTFTIPALADGGYMVQVRATDAASPPNTNTEDQYANDSFTVDTAAPAVSSTSPISGQLNVDLDAVVTATFSEAMDASSITTSSFTLKIGVTPVSGSVSYNAGTYIATFTPDADLIDDTTYTASLTTAVEDVAGNSLAAEYSWSFSTGETSAPTVVSTSPASGEPDVVVGSNVTATFSKAMDESTITAGSFTVAGVSGTVSYNSGTYTATFNPDSNLAYETTYTATLTTAITDAGGTPLASTYSWSFTTEEESAVDPGDANGDGVVDILDVTKTERIIAGLDAETPGADANEDGVVNALDITKIERIIAGLD